MTEKLQKVLARAGLGSRREIEKWISDGRVYVNGQAAKLGDRIALTDRVQVSGRVIQIKPNYPVKPRVLMYHKPEGEICTRHDPEGRPTVFDKLPVLRGQRWVAIGRLDINTSGLLLFTNNGELAHQLLHPSSEIEREYAVRVLGVVDDKIIRQLKKGVELEDGMAAFSEVVDAGGTGANHWYHVILKEGRHREARRLWESQGVTVSRLIRIRFGNVTLPRLLRPGRSADLEEAQIKLLEELVA
jgi:23S rRNA pseudouridine2605 synthase